MFCFLWQGQASYFLLLIISVIDYSTLYSTTALLLPHCNALTSQDDAKWAVLPWHPRFYTHRNILRQFQSTNTLLFSWRFVSSWHSVPWLLYPYFKGSERFFYWSVIIFHGSELFFSKKFSAEWKKFDLIGNFFFNWALNI